MLSRGHGMPRGLQASIRRRSCWLKRQSLSTSRRRRSINGSLHIPPTHHPPHKCAWLASSACSGCGGYSLTSCCGGRRVTSDSLLVDATALSRTVTAMIHLCPSTRIHKRSKRLCQDSDNKPDKLLDLAASMLAHMAVTNLSCRTSAPYSRMTARAVTSRNRRAHGH